VAFADLTQRWREMPFTAAAECGVEIAHVQRLGRRRQQRTISPSSLLLKLKTL